MRGPRIAWSGGRSAGWASDDSRYEVVHAEDVTERLLVASLVDDRIREDQERSVDDLTHPRIDERRRLVGDRERSKRRRSARERLRLLRS